MELPGLQQQREARALQELQALASIPGALMMVRHSHRCGLDRTKADPTTPEEVALCRSYPYPLTDPRHFDASPIVEIQGPDWDGCYVALTADGSCVRGLPSGVLAALTKHAALPGRSRGSE